MQWWAEKPPQGLNFSWPGESANLWSTERNGIISTRGLQKNMEKNKPQSLAHNEPAGPSQWMALSFLTPLSQSMFQTGAAGLPRLILYLTVTTTKNLLSEKKIYPKKSCSAWLPKSYELSSASLMEVERDQEKETYFCITWCSLKNIGIKHISSGVWRKINPKASGKTNWVWTSSRRH